MTPLAARWAHVAHVVCDWNGTLLDDLDLAVSCVKELCVLHAVQPIDREEYRRAFHFPIASFYAEVGFDPAATPFPNLMQEYLKRFDAQALTCPLRPGAEPFLARVRAAGRGLSVLSATHHPALIAAIAAKGLDAVFDHVRGLSDDQAVGKLAEAQALQAELGVPPDAVLFIGDTTHDVEVADALGWQPVVLAGGHQDAARFGDVPAHHVRDFDHLAAELFGPAAAAPGRDQ